MVKKATAAVLETTPGPGETCHTGNQLCMPEDSRKRAARRLAIARGHLESIRLSLDKEDVYCVDVLRQIKAVQGALDGAANVILRGHLEAHIATAATRGDEQELVDELMEVLKYV